MVTDDVGGIESMEKEHVEEGKENLGAGGWEKTPRDLEYDDNSLKTRERTWLARSFDTGEAELEKPTVEEGKDKLGAGETSELL